MATPDIRSLNLAANPIRGSLLSAAHALAGGYSDHWHCTVALPCEASFRVVESYAHPHEDSAEQTPEDACTYLLLVDAAEHGTLPN